MSNGIFSGPQSDMAPIGAGSGTDMLWRRTDLLALQHLETVGKANQNGVALSRMDVSNRKMQVWKSNHQGLIDEALRSLFSQETWRDLRLFPHLATNVLQRVVTDICRLTQEPATRYLRDGTEDEDGERRSLTGRVFELLEAGDAELMAPTPAAGMTGAAETCTCVAGCACCAAGKCGPDCQCGRACSCCADGECPKGAAISPAMGTGGESANDELAADEGTTTPFEKWLAAIDLDTLVGDVQRFARHHPAVWVMPVVTIALEAGATKAKLAYHVYTPATADVITDPKDPKRALAFYIWRDEPVDKKGNPVGPATDPAELVKSTPTVKRFYYVWTETLFGKYDSDWKPVDPPVAHKYGALPVAVVRVGEPIDGYFLDGTGDDLYDATIEICVLRTLMNRRFIDSSFKQIAFHGSPDKVPQGQIMSPGTPIYLGEAGDTATVLDMQVNLPALSGVVKERIEDIAVKYGISPAQWSMTDKSQSGFSKKMDQAKIIGLNRSDRKWFAQFERDLYVLTARTLKGYPVADIGQLDPAAEYVVDYVDPKFEEDPVTQARADAIDLKLNKTNVLELLMRDDPDLTEEDALRRLALNKAINARFIGSDESQLLDIIAEGGRKGQGGSAGGDGGFGGGKP